MLLPQCAGVCKQIIALLHAQMFDSRECCDHSVQVAVNRELLGCMHRYSIVENAAITVCRLLLSENYLIACEYAR